MSQGFETLLDEAYDRVTAIAPLSPSATRTPRKRIRYIEEVGEANRRVGQMAMHLQAILESSAKAENGEDIDLQVLERR